MKTSSYALCARAALLLAAGTLTGLRVAGAMLDLSQAVVVAPASLNPVERQAVTMLIEEVEKRSQLRWSASTTWPTNAFTVIALGTVTELKDILPSALADALPKESISGEGYHLEVRNAPSAVVVCGADTRGVMFGAGRLLRELRMGKQFIHLPGELTLTSAPKTRLRGHQLGYRPKTNSYDAWDVADWEQYFRDLIVFGCNAIELIPPRSDDAADSPHFSRPPQQMMIEMSRLADRYGLDVWIWYPAMDQDYSDPATVEHALQEWGDIFRSLPRIDAVFVPGGDPGHTKPEYLMGLLQRETQRLREFHPKAQMWVSPQSFGQIWLDEFIEILRNDQPAWLSGIVFGPQVSVSLPKLRERVPSRYPIRDYPDITHSRQCQYPVPAWDVAYALTEARECINPRPEDEAAIFRATTAETIGFLTYSEGCNDDVNKAVWSGLGWDPDARVIDILREYSRYFIGAPFTENFAQGLLTLERNWRGPLLANAGVETTLLQFQAMERAASPHLLKNWRFQQALLRAYYDSYVRNRLLHETDLERQAMDRLKQGDATGALPAMTEAEQILNRASVERVAVEQRQRMLELGAALFQSIGMQLSVSKYKAIHVDRGACLDTMDYPLNNRVWLKEQFARIRKLNSEPERLTALRQIIDWENPGPGGFYDDLGNPARQPHLVKELRFDQDPGAMRSPRIDFEEDLVPDEDDPPPQGARRISWMDHAEALYDQPLQVRYTDLDPTAQYVIRVVYAGDSPRRRIRLVANSNFDVHSFITKPLPFKPLEFDVPKAATSTGTLTLSWLAEPGLGGNGRACQVSEVWLIKKAD